MEQPGNLVCLWWCSKKPADVTGVCVYVTTIPKTVSEVPTHPSFYTGTQEASWFAIEEGPTRVKGSWAREGSWCLQDSHSDSIAMFGAQHSLGCCLV